MSIDPAYRHKDKSGHVWARIGDVWISPDHQPAVLGGPAGTARHAGGLVSLRTVAASLGGAA